MKYDNTFETELRNRGYGASCMWQMSGPKNTMVSGMECLCVFIADHDPLIVIVQTFKGGGWSVYAPASSTNDKGAIVAIVDAVEAIAHRK